MQIFLNQKEAIAQSKNIYTLDKRTQIALENNSKKEEGNIKGTTQEAFHNTISPILPNKQETLDISTIMVELASFLSEKDTKKYK